MIEPQGLPTLGSKDFVESDLKPVQEFFLGPAFSYFFDVVANLAEGRFDCIRVEGDNFLFDTPPIISILVEPGDPLGAYGTKAFGEAPVIPVPACIGNAIFNAIGIRFRELPITPEKVLKKLKED
jgi:hypothetical protein